MSSRIDLVLIVCQIKVMFYIQITDVPVARAHLEGATQKLLSWAENVPPLESLTKSETLTWYILDWM
jgi:hypothetical protein